MHACWEDGSVRGKHQIRMSRIMTSLWGFEARPDSPQEERHFPACPTAPESSLPAMIAMFPIPGINR